MTSWIEDIVVKRRSQQTVFLVETYDLKRVEELVSACGKLFPRHEVLLLDLQTGNLRKDNSTVPTDSALQTLNEKLLSTPTVGVLSYVLTQEQAQALYNHMLSWRQNLYASDRLNTAVVFTASVDFFPPALRRFLHTIILPASSVEERLALLKKLATDIEAGAKAKSLPMNITVDDRLLDASAGLTLQDVEAAALESAFRYHEFQVAEFTRRKMEILRGFSIEYIEPTRGFTTVGGYQPLKEYVAWRIIKPLQNPAEAQKYGLTIPKGILLIGPPGTGKTWFSKALAKEIGLTMLKLSPGDFLRAYVGESESRVRQVTQLIETLAPNIVFIDEFDQIALERATTMVTDSGASRRMSNMLLDWMGDENRKSFIIGATNFAGLDKAFIRPGRIDEILPILPPDTEARRQILQVHTSVIRTFKVPLDVDFNTLALRTKWWSGSELEKLVLDAAAIAFKEGTPNINTRHFEDAIRGFEVNIQQRRDSLNSLLNQIRNLEQYNKAFLEAQLTEFNKDDTTTSKIASMFDKDLGTPPDHGVGVA